MEVDSGRAARDHGDHRRGYPDKTFQRLERLGVPLGRQPLSISVTCRVP